ncbi:MAG: bifunctional methylenetetrahydrofolate dehydrogenase/methenyltetrahydrofolate cyclohydrolase FolD [Gemmatimonadaceae bacterium]
MPAELIDGTVMAARVRADVAREVRDLADSGTRPGLAVVLVGDDPASAVYVSAKGRACTEVGIAERTILLAASTTQRELMRLLDELNADASVHGILVQSPLPAQIDFDAVIRRIDPAKDVDGFHPLNVGKLLAGERDGFVPCTPAGVQELLRLCNVPTHGRECVVVGRSNIVGKPMAALMMQNAPGANATVTVCHRYTLDLASHTRRADILVTAVGKPNLITADMIKPGAAVLDVGITRVADASRKSGSRLVGDVDFDGVREVAGLLTPVPGGVGPMTIAMLLRNTVRAAQRAVVA